MFSFRLLRNYFKKQGIIHDIRRSSKVQSSGLVSSVWICHHGDVRASGFQLASLPPAASSLVHDGLVLPLVGEQSLEHLVLSLIKAPQFMVWLNNLPHFGHFLHCLLDTAVVL